jgi:ribosomal protein S18 acetylase RimI-like enzyme
VGDQPGHRTDRPVAIRPFAERDRTALIDLWRRCGLTRPWNDPDRDIDRKLAVGDDLLLVACEESEPVGPVVGTVMVGYDGHRGWINYLAVEPSRQRRGIGEQLMAAAERRLRALGCPKINLQIRRTNVGAVDFYRSLGFVEDEVTSMGKRLVDDAPTGD